MKSNTIFTRILVHIAGWILLFLLPPLIMQSEIKLPDSFGDFMNWTLVILFFYINFLWLVPQFLSKRKFLVYFAGIFFMLSASYFVNEMYARHRYRTEIAKNPQNHRPNENRKRPPRYKGYFSALFCFATLALGTSIKVTEGWYINEKQKKEMENQKLGAELSLLKSQINPHFFFNTLNSIYSLAIIKSERTPEAVLKLSELMRYIIYDTERKVVPLSKEVEYIANYIELQRLRLPDEVKVKFKADLGSGDAVIEPLLLLPFVENAFKHGVDVEKPGKITITIKRSGNELSLHVENPLVDNGYNGKNNQSGIGMNNTLKRLKLLYQENFTFTAAPVKTNYVVDLVIKLKENEVSDS
ncbi:MAG TPA: histidine kinase [Bacteroidales bacterium]|nr:histidine kinase [Bacteroidales bacterium]